MNFDFDARMIFFVRHGSYAYGLNIPSSAEDFKGICIKPKAAYFGFTQNFEQHEHMGSKSDGVDSVVYSLEKFAKLAADCNPSIIEVLHVADEDVIRCDEYGEMLRAHKDDFISKKAKHTFNGYAHAQLHRIKTHKQWLMNPPKAPPQRKDFGLSETCKVSKSELGAYDAVVAQGIEIDVPKDLLTLFTREKAYMAAMVHYEQYLDWVKSRNAARALLEVQFGYDTKHGMHLLRLMRMCREILLTGKVLVKRPDRDDLLDVRFGRRGYDSLVDEAERIEAECNVLYETSTLPYKPNFNKLDELIISMTEAYLRKHG